MKRERCSKETRKMKKEWRKNQKAFPEKRPGVPRNGYVKSLEKKSEKEKVQGQKKS